MKKITLLSALLVLMSSCSSTTTSTGWGTNQRDDTIRGAIGGATIGGIIGHQSGKRDEGILIGTLLGSVIGNNSGKNKDFRNRDHHLEDERARTAQLEYQLQRARELKDLRDRQAQARRDLEQLEK